MIIQEVKLAPLRCSFFPPNAYLQMWRFLLVVPTSMWGVSRQRSVHIDVRYESLQTWLWTVEAERSDLGRWLELSVKPCNVNEASVKCTLLNNSKMRSLLKMTLSRQKNMLTGKHKENLRFTRLNGKGSRQVVQRLNHVWQVAQTLQ